MRIGIHSALVNVGSVDQVLNEVKRTASFGLASYWAPMLGGHDTLTVLALAGREAPMLELGTAVVPMPLRSPFALAQQVHTIQQAIGGRLTLGIGTSHKEITRDLFRADWPPPLQAAREYLQELGELITGISTENAADGSDHDTTVLLGAVNPAMIALAAELAAGMITWSAGTVTIEEIVKPAVAQRDPARPFRLVAALPVCVTDEPARVRSRIQARFGANDRLPSYQRVLRREGVTRIADLAVVGSAAEVGGRLDELQQCGVTDFGAHIMGTSEVDIQRTWQVVANWARNSGSRHCIPPPRRAE